MIYTNIRDVSICTNLTKEKKLELMKLLNSINEPINIIPNNNYIYYDNIKQEWLESEEPKSKNRISFNDLESHVKSIKDSNKFYLRTKSAMIEEIIELKEECKAVEEKYKKYKFFSITFFIIFIISQLILQDFNILENLGK